MKYNQLLLWGEYIRCDCRNKKLSSSHPPTAILAVIRQTEFQSGDI